MFNWFRARRQRRDAAVAAWHKIVEAARAPYVFTEWQVEDTLDGRFDSIALHTFLVLKRIRATGREGEALGQALFDLMFTDFDQALREMGIGDMGVGKRVKEMATAVLGRIAAYDKALEGDDRAMLEEAIHRNLYRDRDVGDGVINRVADFVATTDAALSTVSLQDIAAGQFDLTRDEVS